MNIWVKAACHKSLYYSTATCYSWYPHKISNTSTDKKHLVSEKISLTVWKHQLPLSKVGSSIHVITNHRISGTFRSPIIDFWSWWVKNVKRCDWANCSVDGTRMDGFHRNWLSTQHPQLLHCQGLYLSWGSKIIAFGEWKGQLTKCDKITLNNLNGQQERFNINRYSPKSGFQTTLSLLR